MFDFSMYVWISVTAVTISTIISLLLRYLARNDDYWKKRGIPYSPRISIFTFIRLLTQKPIHELILENSQKYGKLFGDFENSKPALVVSDPDILRNVLVKDFHVFSYRREMKTFDVIVDNMVSVLKGEDWKRVRTIITPAFTSKRMRQMGSIINDCSKSVIELCDKFSKSGEPLNSKRIFGSFTLDVIASAAFATKIDSVNDPDNIFVRKAKQGIQEMSSIRMMLIIFLPEWISRVFRIASFQSMDFFKEVVINVIKERKQKKERYNDMLQIFIDASEEQREIESSDLKDDEDQFGSITNTAISSVKYKHLSEDEILAQCVLFFIVGYETTASTLSFMAYSLALNPEWQEKLIAEVDQAFSKNTTMNYDIVRDMKILDAVVSETLRMYPPLTVIERSAIEEYQLGDTGLTIEKGGRIAIPIYAMHYDPDFFEEPKKFDPSRFLDSNKNKHPQYTYLPFGAGPRNCLGMRFALLEIKLCMTNVLRYYRFRKHIETKVPLPFKKGMGFLSVDDLPLAVEKRSDMDMHMNIS